MVGSVARMLAGVTALSLAEAARILRHHRAGKAETEPHLQSVDAVKGNMIAFGSGATNACMVPDLIFGGVRSAVNNIWAGLEQYDPAIVEVGGNHSFKIIGCNINLETSANISLTGHSEGGIRNLACDSSKRLSSTKTEYTFSAHLAVGDCKDTLKVAGGVDGDWGVCGFDIPRMIIDAAFDLVGAGIKVNLSVEHDGGLNARISKVNQLELSWGVPSGYKCGFQALGVPGFIGDIVSDYCVSLMDWVADRIQGRLQGDAEKLLVELLNRKLDL